MFLVETLTVAEEATQIDKNLISDGDFYKLVLLYHLSQIKIINF